ncbi:MAG: hypothetical protein ACLQHF_08570 [Terracidiphilus sp.]
MSVIESATGGMGSVLLTLASALLFEELTLGVLVRLIVAPRTRTRGDDQSKRCHKDARPPG